MCATNFIDNIDPAVIRPGRFDLIIPIGPPDGHAREALWHAAVDRLDHRDVEVGQLAAESVGFTPSDVALAAQRAAAVAFNRVRASVDPQWVTNEDLLSAMQRTAASVSSADQEHFAEQSLRHSRVGRRARAAAARINTSMPFRGTRARGPDTRIRKAVAAARSMQSELSTVKTATSISCSAQNRTSSSEGMSAPR